MDLCVAIQTLLSSHVLQLVHKDELRRRLVRKPSRKCRLTLLTDFVQVAQLDHLPCLQRLLLLVSGCHFAALICLEGRALLLIKLARNLDVEQRALRNSDRLQVLHCLGRLLLQCIIVRHRISLMRVSYTVLL